LLAYHRWWQQCRDHDRDGLAEYGSTDGTLIAARWESGMDNAERFAAAEVLDNGTGHWSMNQTSPDLNAYLYVDAMLLARFASQLGYTQDAALLKAEAAHLAKTVRSTLFDDRAGVFSDRRRTDHGFVGHSGSEAWIPLWAGIASAAQAKEVAKRLGDPKAFNTFVPFPSLTRMDPAFDAEHGYWRGPVWIDQAYFAVVGLERAGYRKLAQGARQRLLHRAAGLDRNDPVYENYNPLSGRGLNAPNFSWSAAHFLLLMQPPPLQRLWP
jgi:putative isomerase